MHIFLLLAMKLMTGLVKVSLGVTVQLQTTQKRYDIESTKMVPDRSSDRVEELKASINKVTKFQLHTSYSFFHTYKYPGIRKSLHMAG